MNYYWFIHIFLYLDRKLLLIEVSTGRQYHWSKSSYSWYAHKRPATPQLKRPPMTQHQLQSFQQQEPLQSHHRKFIDQVDSECRWCCCRCLLLLSSWRVRHSSLEMIRVPRYCALSSRTPWGWGRGEYISNFLEILQLNHLHWRNPIQRLKPECHSQWWQNRY